MVKFGMTPAQAIRSATITAAELLGTQDSVGTIEAGKLADIVAVPGIRWGMFLRWRRWGL